jgi:uncharacterized membrane protein
MNITKSELAAVGIVLLTFFVSAYFYPQIPEKMATHWNIKGQVNGYMSKSTGLFMIPGTLTAIVAFLVVIPQVISVSANIEGFRKFYSGFAILFSIFLLAVQYQIILWNLGIEINPLVVILAMSPVFIVWIAVWFYLAYRRR